MSSSLPLGTTEYRIKGINHYLPSISIDGCTVMVTDSAAFRFYPGSGDTIYFR